MCCQLQHDTSRFQELRAVQRVQFVSRIFHYVINVFYYVNTVLWLKWSKTIDVATQAVVVKVV